MAARTIIVIDSNSLMHRAFHALPPTMTAPDGRPTNAAFGFLSMLVKLVQEFAPDGIVAAFDAGKPAFRTDALSQYKAHRPPTAQELKDQFPMVKHLLETLRVPVVEVQGWEADDILGTFAAAGSPETRILLVTGDRDAYQLVNEHVQVVSTQKGVSEIIIYGPAEVEARYGVTPAQVPDYLGLKGDTSDNIPGVPGVGEKTAAKLLQEFGSMDAALEQADSVSGKVGESLRQNADLARASRIVATISRDVPVDLDLADVTWGCFDPAEVSDAFSELRFTTLRDRVLALRGAAPAGTSDCAAPIAAQALEVNVLRGPDARAALASWEKSPDALLGLSIDEGDSASLFDDTRGLAVAGQEGVALVGADDTASTLAALLSHARIATADAKALCREALDVTDMDDSALDVALGERVFDCALAAYLLESNRSSYASASLVADYLHQGVATASEGVSAAAIDAVTSRALGAELETRLIEDGDSLGVLRDIEMPLVPVLVRMERLGIAVDPAVLEGLSTEMETGVAELRAKIFAEADGEFLIDSPKQLGEVLFDRMGLPKGKKTKTGWSTDASVLTGLLDITPIAQMIMDYRELAKLKSTYVDALPRMRAEDGRVHTSFNQTVAATGRLSSTNPNLQNIPVRTELGRRIRAAFVPGDPGWSIVSADYSQIELRILAHLSQDAGLIEAFTSGMDFHTATAARVFGVPVDGVPPELRARAKAINFGIVYGQSAHGLSDSLKISHPEAQTMIDRYYATFPRVRSYLDEVIADAHRTGFAQTLYGRRRRIPELASSNYNLRSFGERTAMNHPMQGTASDIIKLAMIQVDRRLRDAGFTSRLLLQVHDELVFEAPAEEIGALSDMVRDAMCGVVDLAAPLEVSVATGANWAVAK